MPMSEIEILALMRENAALRTLESEVILALKANAVQDREMLSNQINNILACLQRVDEIRRKNDARSESEEESS